MSDPALLARRLANVLIGETDHDCLTALAQVLTGRAEAANLRAAELRTAAEHTVDEQLDAEARATALEDQAADLNDAVDCLEEAAAIALEVEA